MKQAIVHLSLIHFGQALCSRWQTPLSYPDYDEGAPLVDECFDAFVTATLEEYNVPGCSVAIVTGNDTWSNGYGFAKLPDTKATPDTIYHVASTTKSFTAASILKIIEETVNNSRPLTLKTKMVDLLGWKLTDEYITQHATIEDALSHRTGFPRHDLSYGGVNFTIDSLIDSLRYLDTTAELREVWQYSNVMFALQQRVIEQTSGYSWNDYLNKTIWAPLGMNHSFVDYTRAGQHAMSTGYYFDNRTKEYYPNVDLDLTAIGSAGNILSSVSDFAKYLRAMLHKDPAVLKEKSYDELRTARMIMPHSETDSWFTGTSLYSLGWMINIYEGIEIFHHSGGLPGYATLMFYAPKLDFAAAVFANADVGGAPVTLTVVFELLNRRIGATHRNARDDVHAIFDAAFEKRLDGLKRLREVMYPDAPSPNEAIKHALPLQNYTGAYFNPGYRYINITLGPSGRYLGVPIPSEDGMILRAEVTDKTLPHLMEFEHVSAEQFLVRMQFMVNNATNMDNMIEPLRAKFEIGANGKVADMAISYAPNSKGEPIWTIFKKVS